MTIVEIECLTMRVSKNYVIKTAYHELCHELEPPNHNVGKKVAILYDNIVHLGANQRA